MTDATKEKDTGHGLGNAADCELGNRTGNAADRGPEGGSGSAADCGPEGGSGNRLENAADPRAEHIPGNTSDKKHRNISGWLMGFFTLGVLGIFPFVYHNYYYDILETKYQFYSALAIITAVLMLLYGIFSGNIWRYFKNSGAQRLIKSLSVPDCAMIAFWLCHVISWLLCPEWKWDAFWGTFARYTGVFLVTIYMTAYFLITRFFHFRKIWLDVFLAFGILVCFHGITDYFQMDILGFKAGMNPEQRSSFMATFGNINTYTVYIGMLMVISVMLFCLEEHWPARLWYWGMMVLSMTTLVMGSSDNAYLTLAALFGFSPLYLFRKKSWLRRYLASISTFFSVLLLIGWINLRFADRVLGIDSLFSVISATGILPVAALMLWTVTGIVYLCTRRKRSEADNNGKFLIWMWTGVIFAVVLAVGFVLYDANFAGNAQRYASVGEYLVFNDSWGSNRGFVWTRSIEAFRYFLTPLQRIFGYGPELFKILMQEYYYDEMTRVVFDNAHNEYLHYLLTIGIAGLTSYLIFLISSIVHMAKHCKDRPEIAAVMFAIIAYAVQASVNLNVPVVMPIIIHLLSMGMSRKEPASDSHNDSVTQ